MSWTIKGEAGKTLDATARTLEELGISSATLKFQSLAPDTLTWTAETTDATGSGTIVPDIGQIVEIFDGATRKFKGHVTKPVVDTKQITVTAEGPWWWMTRIGITSTQTDGVGGTSERPLYVFTTGDHQSHIETLIDRMITLGVPMVRGTVDAMFDVPRTTLADQSCASALGVMMAWVPDAVCWFDYSGTDPKINISRRGDMSAETYTIGTDPVEVCKLSPRLDLEVSRTELKYMTRQALTGLPEFATQSSGTDVTGKRQMIAISGPEIVDFLPKDSFQTVDIHTIDSNDAEATIRAWALDANSFLASLAAEYGSTWYTVMGGGSSSIRIATSSGEFFYLSGGSLSSVATIDAEMIDSEGSTLSPTSWFAVRSTDRIPDWLTEAGVSVKEGIFKMDVVLEVLYNTGDPLPTTDGITEYRKHIRADITNGFADTGGTVRKRLSIYRAEIPVTFISTSYPTLTTVYKPWDYDFLTPPTGLAAALVAAQNWVPWEGQIKIVSDNVSGDNLLANKFNAVNALTPCATMDTLAKGVTHELLNGRTTIDLGSPARLDFGTLVSRIRRDPKDNIVYL